MVDKIETDEWDNGIEDDLSPSKKSLDDIVDADKKELGINKSDIERLIQASEEMRRAAEQIIGIGQDFCSLFVTETGQLKDFTDKEGRKNLQKAVENLQKQVDGIEPTMHDHEERTKALCQETLHAIPSEITTQFCKQDRTRLDFFQDKLNKYGKAVIVGLVITGIVLGIAMYIGAINTKYANELKEIENENAQALEFGKFMRENNPKTWNRWQQTHSPSNFSQENNFSN